VSGDKRAEALADQRPFAGLTVGEAREMWRGLIREELATRPAANDVARPDDLLTTPEAAVYCRLSKRVLLAHVQAGRLVPDARARKGFRVHRFKRSTLDALLAGGER
jgi:hypothetical protein